jgi:outer membrane protein assembly factor BamD
MRILFTLSVLAITTIMTGCASTGGDHADEIALARETVTGRGDRALERSDAETIYNTARALLDSGDPIQALQLYSELEARFPFSEYATQAQAETIYAHYKAQQPEAAIAVADRFIKQHPRFKHIDYVYYLRGVVNYNRDRGNFDALLGESSAGRDPGNLRLAFTDFNILIQNFPDSIYRKDAQLRMIDIKHDLARYELHVADYYLGRRAWVAASRRAEYVLENYQGSNSIPRALEILEHSYRGLGLEEKADDTLAVLMVSYPNYLLHRREFYRQRAGLEPEYELPAMDAEPTVTVSGDEDDKAGPDKVSRAAP